MTLQQFIDKWNGQKADFDGYYGDQLNRPILNFSNFSNLNSIFYVAKPSKENVFVHHFNIGRPFISSFIPTNTNMSRSIIRAYFPISKVSSICAYTNILAAVIKRVMVNMVNIFSFRRIKNKAVDFYNFMINTFLSVISSSFFNYTPLSSKFFNSFVIRLIKKYIMSSKRFANNFKFFYINSLSVVNQ